MVKGISVKTHKNSAQIYTQKLTIAIAKNFYPPPSYNTLMFNHLQTVNNS